MATPKNDQKARDDAAADRSNIRDEMRQEPTDLTLRGSDVSGESFTDGSHQLNGSLAAEDASLSPPTLRKELNVFDVIAVAEAEGNYVLLSRSSGSYLLRARISTLAESLRPYGFIRIHRSVLINSSWVQDIQACTSGEYRLRIKGSKEYSVSRTYKRNLRTLARLWIGNDSLFGD